jgi:cell wall-associated NlpC family hydrolase
MTGADVVAAAREQMGVKWQHQARLPGVALDCAGLVICVARHLGLVPADMDVNGYSRRPDGSMLRWCAQYMQPLDVPRAGAVLVGAWERHPQHMGILADYRHGGHSLIHSCSTAGKVIETRMSRDAAMRAVALYWMPGVDA